MRRRDGELNTAQRIVLSEILNIVHNNDKLWLLAAFALNLGFVIGFSKILLNL